MKNKRLRTICTAAVILLVLLAVFCLRFRPGHTEKTGEIIAYAGLESITTYGNVQLERGESLPDQDKKLHEKDLNAAGIECGDTVELRFLDTSVVVPVVRNYSEVSAGEHLICLKDDFVELSINMQDFASSHFADKTTAPDGSAVWAFKEGIQGPVMFCLTLREKGGAKDLFHLSYTDERSDYASLSDEEFANFRMVTTTGMGKGTLYRTASPVDPKFKRNSYGDAAIRRAGVATIMNLSDTREEVESFPGYADSYYATTDYIALKMGMSATAEDFKVKLAQGLRFFAEHEGPYAFHCLEGKDRTGIVAELLECFMGASFEEVRDDYMVTFYNYFGVKPGTPEYDTIVNNNLVKILGQILGTEDLEHADLAGLTEAYFRSIGLTDAEMDALRANLGKSAEAPALPAAA